jgi:hypothetical protein
MVTDSISKPSRLDRNPFVWRVTSANTWHELLLHTNHMKKLLQRIATISVLL